MLWIFREWLTIVCNIHLRTLGIKGMLIMKIDVLLMWIQLGQFWINIAIIDHSVWCITVKWYLIYGAILPMLAMTDLCCISSNKNMLKPSVTHSKVLQSRQNETEWETLALFGSWAQLKPFLSGMLITGRK